MAAIYQPQLDKFVITNPADAAFKGFAQGFSAVKKIKNSKMEESMMKLLMDKYGGRSTGDSQLDGMNDLIDLFAKPANTSVATSIPTTESSIYEPLESNITIQ